MKNEIEDPTIFICKELAKFFKDEPEKIGIWLLTKNPNFGGISPAELISIREEAGLQKVAKFVKNSIEDNG